MNCKFVTDLRRFIRQLCIKEWSNISSTHGADVKTGACGVVDVTVGVEEGVLGCGACREYM